MGRAYDRINAATFNSFLYTFGDRSGKFFGYPMAARIIRWLLFSVGLGVLPIGFVALKPLARTAGKLSWPTVLERGELLIISAALAGAAVGDLIGTSAKARTFKIIAGGVSVALTLLAAYEFADITAGWAGNDQMDPAGIMHISLWVFGGTFLSGLCCSFLAGLDEPKGTKETK